jgi:hypothetical protein
MATRVGTLALLITRALLRADATAAEAQAALLVALRQARKANMQRGEPGANDEAARLEREFFEQAEADDRGPN